MPSPKQTWYEVLGVARDAKLTDIGRAYNRHKSDMQKDKAPPDPKRAALLKEAFDALSDPERRAAYDASLDVRKSAFRRRWAIATAAVVTVLAAAAFHFLQRPPVPQNPARSVEEILADAARAVGRVEAIDISGRVTPVGLAVAIEEGVMVTSCQGLPPGTQIVVSIPPRSMPARVATVDNELGLCKLAVEGVGSRPLALGAGEPKVGQKVYAARVNSVGQVALTEGKVKNVLASPKGKTVESSIAVTPGNGGSPLLDVYGRVVGIATLPTSEAQGRHVPVPVAWVTQARDIREPPVAPAATQPQPLTPPSSTPRVPKSVEDLAPERRERLEKAFRPPPTVPEDL